MVVETGAVAAFADAIGERDHVWRNGAATPITYAVVATWDCTSAAWRDVLDDDQLARGVHGEQRITLRRPLRCGDVVVPRSRTDGVVRRSSGVTASVVTEGNVAGSPVFTSVFTLFVPDAVRSGGRRAVVPSEIPGTDTRATVVTEPVECDQATRYAAASGDDFAIHLDDDAARALGYPGVILHGMCTLAFAARAVGRVAAGSCGCALAELSARFTGPVYPGDTLTTTVAPAADGTWGFVTDTDSGDRALSLGRALPFHEI